MDEPSAAATLDRIRAGGAALLLAAKRSHMEVGVALEQGDFSEALAVCGKLQDRLKRLSDAELMVGRMAEGHLVVCDTIEVGAKLLDIGTVTSIDDCPACGSGSCGHMLVTVMDDEGAENQMLLARAAEIVVTE